MSERLVTFVIPTVGRPSLRRAIDSLYAQTDDGWRAIVVTDGHKIPTPVATDEGRIERHAAPWRKSAGLTRNYALPLVQTAWTAFLDDDDTVSPQYVEWLRLLQKPSDVVVFRMQTQTQGVLPPWINPELRWGQVGISYAVRTSWLAGRGLCFIREHDVNDRFGGAANEDIHLLDMLRALGARITIAEHVGYFVRPGEPADPAGPPDYVSTDEASAARLAEDYDTRAER